MRFLLHVSNQFANYYGDIDMTVTGLDDVGSPSNPLATAIQDNAEAFTTLLAQFIADTHPDITLSDLTTRTITGSVTADTTFYQYAP